MRGHGPRGLVEPGLDGSIGRAIMTLATRRTLGALAIGTILATMPLHAGFDASGGFTLRLWPRH